MNIILLSGGSGKRLWPLSNDIRSKQFIKFFKNDDGVQESMIQRIYRQIKKIDKKANIVVANSSSQAELIHEQLENEIQISLEPSRKGTFCAIALATMYLKDVLHLDENESVVVCPIDAHVGKDYFECIKFIYERIATQTSANLVMMGIEPTYPSDKYGYIIPKTKNKVSSVSMFKEKPSVDVAKKYIEQGALYNGGITAFKLKYVIDLAHKLIDFVDYHDLYKKYNSLKTISFEYEIAEHEKNIEVVRFNGKWEDVGTWETLTDSLESNIIGNGMIDDTSKNVSIINELGIPVLAMGLKDVVIALSPDGILVADKKQSSNIKPFVEKLSQQNNNFCDK